MPPLRFAAFLATLGALLAAPGAQAQGLAGPGADRHWGLGLGLVADRAPYRDFDNKVQALPLVYFENRWVSLLGPSLDVKLPSAGPVGLRLRARYAGDGFEAEDSPFLVGMDERKSGMWLGGAAMWRTSMANLSAEWLADASGHSKGQRFKLQLDRRFQQGAFDVTPRLAVHRVDGRYVDYYYGVKTSEALPQRRAYQGEATANVELGLRVGYAIAPRQSMFLDIHTTRLGRGIKDSPLVDRSSTSGLGLGYLYRF